MPRELNDEQRQALDAFAETINDHDPRERLLRDASAPSAKVGDGPMSAAKDSASGGERRGLDRRRGVFMISVAAELAEMHPQTLRMYEARGLITPKRSPKNTRLYSYEDVERLRRIQQMTAEEGLNLAGVETVLALERELERARAEVARMRERADRARAPDGRRARARAHARCAPRSSPTAPTTSRSPSQDPDRAQARRPEASSGRSRSATSRTVSVAYVERRHVVGEHGDRELARAVALAQLGRLVRRARGREPAALEPHRPVSPAAAGDTPALVLDDRPQQSLGVLAMSLARTCGRGRRRTGPGRRR